jgi:hypothetical protein
MRTNCKTAGRPSRCGANHAGSTTEISGTGAYEGLEGSGRMETKFETDTRGRETFTGTVVP